MKPATFLFLTILLFSFNSSEVRIQKFENGQVAFETSIENGMFNGYYRSYYKNGKKKAEGIFKNNQRIGIWTVYDSLGQKRIVREYTNSFQFSILTSKSERGESVSLPEKKNYELARNKEDYYDYPEVLEKDIAVSKRIWRFIEPEPANSALFDKKELFDIIVKNITETKKLTAFDTESDEFKKEISIADVRAQITNEKVAVIGYRIKEDWFYNSDWQLAEARIIGICPVVKAKSDGKQTDLFWIYYPELRSILASVKLSTTEDTLISTLEDILHFRHFSSCIYKESNVFDRKISDYKTGKEIHEEAEKIEMDILDLEHDIWIESSI